MKEIIYFNGEFKEAGQVTVSLEDRGYLFADGIYEVVLVFNGQPFRYAEHLKRLERSARGLDFEEIDYQELPRLTEELLEKNGLKEAGTAALLYIQISRGTEPRSHAYSDNLTPNILLKATPYTEHPLEKFQQGVKAITLADERWARCYIKTIALLPNVLAKKKAKRAGAFEAILVRDGFVTEGTSSNLFIVRDGELFTPPATNYILEGITRQAVIELAEKANLKVREESISLADLYNADEVFLSGTTSWVMPVVEIDDRTIANGKPGNLTRQLLDSYREMTRG